MVIPSLTLSSLEMTLRRTSDASSFKSNKKTGRRCSITLFLPKIGDKPLIWVATAALTCWDPSTTRSLTAGKISFKTASDSIIAEKPGIWPEAALRTSASTSRRRWIKAFNISSLTICDPTTLASCIWDVTLIKRINVPKQTCQQPCIGLSSSCRCKRLWERPRCIDHFHLQCTFQQC